MPLDSVSRILGTIDRVPRKVPVPQWGGEVLVCAMAASDLPTYLEGNLSQIEMVSRCICDKSGKPLTWSPVQLAELGQKHAAAIDIISLEILRLTGFVEDEQEAPQPIKVMQPDDWAPVVAAFKEIANGKNKQRRHSGNDSNGEDSAVRERDAAVAAGD